MERRDFLKFALGVAASAAALGASAQAAPLAPHSLNDDALRAASQDAHPAVTTEDEVDHLKPEQVRWGHGHGWGHGHHYGWDHGVIGAGTTVIGAGIAVTGAGTVAGIVIIGTAATGSSRHHRVWVEQSNLGVIIATERSIS